ncbi:MAG: HTH domain-containing protein, partial [Bacilli bacterium]
MEERNYLVILYDYYGELLSDLAKKYFESYYFDNLSLAEIAENYKVSRNAIHKQIKNAEIKLVDFESKLNLYNKNKKLKTIISKISDKTLIKELES